MLRASDAAEALARNQASLATSQRIAQLGSWEFDYDQGTMLWSDQLYHLLGLTIGEVNPSPGLLVKFVYPDDSDRVSDWLKLMRSEHQEMIIDHLIKTKDGTTRNVRQQLEKIFDSSGNLVSLHATVQDITDLRAAEKKINQLAYYDTLTGLANRTLFQDVLGNAINIAERNESLLAIFFFDLDNFKRVNDTFGHAIGDKLLKRVGERLSQELRSGNLQNGPAERVMTLARMGGDEFTLLVDNIDNHHEVNQIAEHIFGLFTEPFTLESHLLFTSPSVGVSLYPQDGKTSEQLLKNADMAMYDAKRAGRNAYKTYNEDRDVKMQSRHHIDNQLRLAMDADEFTLHYQPQVGLHLGEICAAEVLLRWTNAELGPVPPADFIPIAEENGLIVPIGEWILQTACQQAKQWIDEGFLVSRVAVNVSVHQFMRADFADMVAQILEETDLGGAHLELEITESVLASDIQLAVTTLGALKNLGVQLSIDDFGTGYSSLSQIKHFPIDRFKIDQSFVKTITDSHEDAAIARAVIAMADSMQICVLAEGVETESQLEFLRGNGCDEIQGFLIGKPAAADQFVESMPDILATIATLFHHDTSDKKKAA